MDTDLAYNPENKTFGFKNIAIKDMTKIEDWLFIILENNQKILTNGKEVYDFSDYDALKDIFAVNGKVYASLTKGFTLFLVDIHTQEVLFQDSDALHISMKNERILHVIKKIGKGNNTIFNLVTKKYLPVPENYEFEKALSDNLYVFREDDCNKKFYELKRRVISADGKVIMSQIEGWIDLIDNYLIITKGEELSIYEMNNGVVSHIKTFKKGEDLIAKPCVYKGYIVIIEKGIVKLLKPNLEVAKKYKVEGLEEVIDSEWVEDTLKLAVPYVEDGEKINKQMHINFKTGKIISHVRIDGYPYWTPTTFVGRDIANFSSDEGTNFYFYDRESNMFFSINAIYYDVLGNNEQIFFIASSETNYLLNSETRVLQKVLYSSVCFHATLPYGFAVNGDVIDFIDRDFSVLVSGINYKYYELDLTMDGFGYFIVNGYLRLNIPFEDEYGRYRNRCVLIAPNKEIVIDSIKDECYQVGDFIQIVNKSTSWFLDTKTGKKGVLNIKAPINDNGIINFSKLGNIASVLAISNESKEGTFKRERRVYFEDTEEEC